MSAPLIAIVGVIYLFVAVSYFRDGNLGMAIAFFCYACSNVGFILATFK